MAENQFIEFIQNHCCFNLRHVHNVSVLWNFKMIIIIKSPGLLSQDFEAPGWQRKSEIQEQHFTCGSLTIIFK